MNDDIAPYWIMCALLAAFTAAAACTPLPKAEPPPKNHWVESKVANAVYVQDRRTGQCFATWMTGGDSSHVITAVVCTPAVLQAVAEDTQP